MSIPDHFLIIAFPYLFIMISYTINITQMSQVLILLVVLGKMLQISQLLSVLCANLGPCIQL